MFPSSRNEEGSAQPATLPHTPLVQPRMGEFQALWGSNSTRKHPGPAQRTPLLPSPGMNSMPVRYSLQSAKSQPLQESPAPPARRGLTFPSGSSAIKERENRPAASAAPTTAQPLSSMDVDSLCTALASKAHIRTPAQRCLIVQPASRAAAQRSSTAPPVAEPSKGARRVAVPGPATPAAPKASAPCRVPAPQDAPQAAAAMPAVGDGVPRSRPPSTRELHALLADNSSHGLLRGEEEGAEGGGPSTPLGRVDALSPVKAGRTLGKALGSATVLTPVRRSSRSRGGASASRPAVAELLESTDYAYTPNAALLVDDDGCTPRSTHGTKGGKGAKAAAEEEGEEAGLEEEEEGDSPLLEGEGRRPARPPVQPQPQQQKLKPRFK